MSSFWTDIAINTLLFFYVLISLLMCLVVLMQRSKQEGLGAAFGGGFTDSVWGAQTSQVLVKATVWLAFFFFALSIVLARLYSHRESLSPHGATVKQDLLQPVPGIVTNAAPTAPAVPAAPTPATSVSNTTLSAPASAAPAVKAPATTPSNAAPAKPDDR